MHLTQALAAAAGGVAVVAAVGAAGVVAAALGSSSRALRTKQRYRFMIRVSRPHTHMHALRVVLTYRDVCVTPLVPFCNLLMSLQCPFRPTLPYHKPPRCQPPPFHSSRLPAPTALPVLAQGLTPSKP